LVMAKMLAAVADHYGGPEVLQIKEVPIPKCSPTQVLVKMHAAAAKGGETRLRQGYARWIVTKLPYIPGHEGSGVVHAVGSKVTTFKVGDEVYGVLSFSGFGKGTCAQFCAFEESNLALKPPNLTHIEAATLPAGALTAHSVIEVFAKPKKGQRALVIGASGGAGSHIAQYAKFMGMYVIGVCSFRNVDWVKEHTGVDEVIDYTKNKYSDILSQEEDKVDFVFDAIGDNISSEQGYTVLKPGGSFITINSINYFRVLGAKLGIFRPFATIGTMPVTQKSLAYVTTLFAENKLKPLVGDVLPLSEIQEVHRRLDSGRIRGKLAIEIPQ